jgi:intracellular multiplication protein IcmE
MSLSNTANTQNTANTPNTPNTQNKPNAANLVSKSNILKRFEKISTFPRKYLVAGVMVIVLVMMALVAILVTGLKNHDITSNAKSLTKSNIEGSVGGKGTPEYNNLIEEENREKAQIAKENGKSYIPVPTGEGTEPLSNNSPLVKRERVVVANSPSISEETQTTDTALSKGISPQRGEMPLSPYKREENASSASKVPLDNRAILVELRQLREQGKTVGTPVVISLEPKGRTESNGQLSNNGNNGGNSSVAHYSNSNGMGTGLEDSLDFSSSSFNEQSYYEKIYGLSPGDVLYAITNNALNSDIPSPVLLTTVGGKLKGSKVLGNFKLTGENVLLSFYKLITKDGVEIDIEAFGVDPDTSAAAVKSNVDTHFLQRWGSLMGASFIEGFGRAMGRKNTRVYTQGDTVVEDGTYKTMKDISFEALEKVGSRAATQVERGFDRLPTVTVKAGEHVGILILSVGGK